MTAMIEEPDSLSPFDPEATLAQRLAEPPETYDLEMYLKDEPLLPTDTVRTVQAARLLTASVQTLNDRLLHRHALHGVGHAQMVIDEVAGTLGALRETAMLLMAWMGTSVGPEETASVGPTMRALAELADNLDDIKRQTMDVPMPADRAPQITPSWLAEQVTLALRSHGIAVAESEIYDDHLAWQLAGGFVLTVSDDIGGWNLWHKESKSRMTSVAGIDLPTAVYAHPVVVAEAVAEWQRDVTHYVRANPLAAAGRTEPDA